MPWQVVNQVVLHAGNTIINPNGMFVYSGAPASGNLIFSAAPAAGTDTFGNAYVEGAASYVTIAGTIYALEVGSQTGSGNAFLVHNLTSPPSADPLFSAIQAGPTGCVAAVLSGKSAVGSGQASVQVADSVAAGVTGGQVVNVCGQAVLNNSGSAIPLTDPVITTLPNDTNSGMSWGVGERAFMNTSWVAAINTNFTNILTTLRSAGIIV